jgi:hypothetical protein
MSAALSSRDSDESCDPVLSSRMHDPATLFRVSLALVALISCTTTAYLHICAMWVPSPRVDATPGRRGMPASVSPAILGDRRQS